MVPNSNRKIIVEDSIMKTMLLNRINICLKVLDFNPRMVAALLPISISYLSFGIIRVATNKGIDRLNICIL
jgi:hypothetical protein